MHSSRTFLALGLFAWASLHGREGFITIENRTADPWVVEERESKGARGSWALQPHGAFEMKFPHGLIAAGSAVTVRVNVPKGAAAPDLCLRQAGTPDGPLPLGLSALDWDGPARVREVTFTLRPGPRLEAVAAGRAHGPDLGSSSQARDDSPASRLDITEEPRNPVPLAGFPLALQKKTIGKPRMLVINESSAPWLIVPLEGSPPFHLVLRDGQLLTVKPKYRYRLSPKKRILIATEGTAGWFGLQDSVSNAMKACVQLSLQEIALSGLPVDAKEGPPPGIFLRRIEDSQSFVIRKDAYPSFPTQRLKAFPPEPVFQAMAAPILEHPCAAKAYLAEPAPLDPGTLEEIKDLEDTLAGETFFNLLNESGAAWRLVPEGKGAWEAGIMAPDGMFDCLESGELVDLPAGKVTTLVFHTAEGRCTLEDAVSGIHALVTWNPDGVEITADATGTGVMAPLAWVRRIAGGVRSFRILPALDPRQPASGGNTPPTPP